jgi:hypothetical protein
MLMLTRAWNGLRRFWGSDVSLSAFLGVLVLLLFVAPSFAARDGNGRSVVLDAGFTVLLFSGIAAISVGPVLRVLLTVLVVVATVVRWGAFSPAARVSAGLMSIVAMTIVVLTQVFRSGTVTVHRVQGAVAAYLLLGLAWALAYDLVASLDPAAFTGGTSVAGDRTPFAYFSFVTLTTVGYGDVTPVHPVARSLAMAEALTGQLYPAILLARLVSLSTTGSSGGTPPARWGPS